MGRKRACTPNDERFESCRLSCPLPSASPVRFHVGYLYLIHREKKEAVRKVLCYLGGGGLIKFSRIFTEKNTTV
jgi:hypothetical protein